MFPVDILVFSSSTLVQVATIPGWLQAFADHQRVNVTDDALRALCLGELTTWPVLEALAWIAALLALAEPLADARYRRSTS